MEILNLCVRLFPKDMLRVYKVLFLLLAAAMPAGLCAQQVTARVAGLEGNAKYMSLLAQEQRLHHTEDSVVQIIDRTRQLFADNQVREEREKYASEILRLEKELFEIRNRIGVTANEIGAIEQEFIVSNMGGAPSDGQSAPQAPSAPAAKQVSNLVYNTYFKDNLSAHDYELLCEAQQQESLPAHLIATYLSNYRTMDSLATEYDTISDRVRANEAYEKLRTIGSLNKAVEDSIAKVWGYIYDNKVYAYNYLFDKMGKSELLSDFESKFQAARQQVAMVRDSVISETVYGYPLFKRLVLAYEQTLAGMLGYTSAKDSIDRQIARMKDVFYALPRIEPEQRVFIVYGDIERSTPSVYNAQNPIPVNETDQYGTVYRIQVGVFQQKQPVSVFRGVSPLCYDKTEEGRYRYCAGAFRELSEAQAALVKLKEMGFRKPEIVVWKNGVFEMIGGELADAAQSEQTLYRVEIVGQGETISESIREVTDKQAADKELSRIVTDQGTYIYSVGSFESREEADSLCRAVNAAVEGCATVLTLDN